MTPSQYLGTVLVPFLKGHGVAASNAYGIRYKCPCGLHIAGPHDDPDLMVEVMDHEVEHAEVAS